MTYRRLTLRPLNALLTQALGSRMLKRAALGAGALAPVFAFANPTGGQVAAGSATITAPDANHTIINQASQNAIINWQEFSIGSDQFVQFIQPDSSAIALNRVVGGNPSQILGNLSANGQIFLVNPNGVFFGKSATLDVQGLIATTLDIKDSDFLNGHYVFDKTTGAPDAGVTNAGSLTANSGYIVLAGDYADNQGAISAQTGQVVLAAGNQMTLTLNNNSLVSFVVNKATLAQYAGVSNSGSITANGGIVLMTAKVANALTATAVNNSGLITAHSIKEHNGVIVLSATGGDIHDSGTLDASATDAGVAGGYLRIRGDGHTEITSTASINAAGDSAKGGFVELSGHTLSMRGKTRLGHSGSLLIDPSKVSIATGSTVPSSTAATTYQVGVGYIQTQLNLGNNVNLIASNSITHAAGVTSLTATGAGNLTVKTGTLATAASGATLGPSGFQCWADGICITQAAAAGATFTPGNGTINLSGMTINIAGGFTANAGNGAVTLSNITAKNVTLTGGSVTVGNVSTSGTGIAINITADQTSSYGGPAIISAGSLTATAGSVHLIQKHGTNTYTGSGGKINVTGAITAAGGASIAASDKNGPSGGKITLGGNVTGKYVYISTQAKKGNGITVTGGVKATGTGVGSGVNLYAKASGGAASSGGTITVNGSNGISAAGGAVQISGSGGGNTGGNVNVKNAIKAAGVISVKAVNLGTGTAAGAHLVVGKASGQNVRLYADGASATVSAGSLLATGLSGGTQTPFKGAVTVQLQNAAGTAGAATGSMFINGAIKSSHSSVVLSGPAVTAGTAAGSISAGKAVTITATQKITLNGNVGAGIGSSNAFGPKKITLSAPVISTKSLRAHGSVTTFQGITLAATKTATSGPAIITVNGSIATKGSGDVTLAQAGGSTGTGTNGGSITVTGSISAATGHSKVTITASDTKTGGSHGGNITLGAVNGGPINISARAKIGANITVARLASHPSGGTGNISVFASDTSAAANGGNIKITSTGPAVVAGNGGILLNAVGGGASGGRISVAGSIGSPLGTNNGVNITAKNTGTATGTQIKLASVFGKYVHVNAYGLKPTVSVGAMTAKGSPTGSLTADAAVILHPQTGSGSASGQINVSGNIKSSHSGVTLNAGKGDVTVASTASITAGKTANFTGHKLTLGNVTAAGSLGVTIQDMSRASPGVFMASTATLSGLNVTVQAAGTAAFAPTFKLGNVTATGTGANGNVHINDAVSNQAVNVTAGNLTGQFISVNASDGNISAGALTAPIISVVTQKGNVTLGAINAVSSNNKAKVLVQAHGGSAAASNAVTINGNVTVQGKTPATSSSASQFGMPEAAALNLSADGTSGFAHNVTVNGSVTVKALAGTFNINQRLYARIPNGSGGTSTKSFNLLANGSGGVATANITAGNSFNGTAKVTGAVSITGPDAHLNVMGNQISLGSLTVTGNGHTITRTITPVAAGSTGSYSSNNSAGQATVYLDAQNGAIGSVKTGAINISGKGVGEAAIFGKTVTGGNITVNTAAATAKRTANTIKMGCSASGSTGPCGATSGDLFRGFGDKDVKTGTLHGGRANIDVTGGYAASSSKAATSISLGSLSATGVGGAAVRLKGNTVAVQSVTALTTKGSLSGSASIHKWKSGSVSGTLKQTFNEKGGGAFVDLHGGHSGGLTVTGNLSAKGPRAGVSLTGKTINVGGGVTVSGSGASLTSDVVFTPSTGTTGKFHTHFTGPGDIVGFTAEGGMSTGGSINVGGSISVTGSGMVGAEILANAVNLHNVSLNVTKAAAYTLLDTRNSPSTESFTAGSAGLIVANAALPTTGSNLLYTPATITGNVSITAPTNAYTGIDATVSGNVSVTATGKNVIGNNLAPFRTRLNKISKIVNLHNGSGSSVTGALPTLNLSAGNVTLTAGSNLLLGSNALTAATSLNLSGAAIAEAGLVTANSVTVTAGTGAVALTLKAPNIDIVSGGNVALNDSAETSAATLTMGTGTFGSVAATFGGAATLATSLTATSVNLNATGALNLGSNTVTLTGAATLAGNGVTGSGLLTATTLTVTGGSGAVNLVTKTPSLTVMSGGNVALYDSAETSAATLTMGTGTFGSVAATFGGAATVNSALSATTLNLNATGALNLGSNAMTLTGAATLTGAGVTGTGLLTATTLSVTGGSGAVSLVAKTPSVNVVSAGNVTLNDSAETGAATFKTGTATFGAISATFGGAATLANSLTATSLNLNAAGALGLGANTLTLSSNATLGGAGVTGTGLVTAGALTVNGGAGTTSLVTDVANLTIGNGSNVTLDNTANTAATTVNFGGGTFGNIALTFNGNATLGSGLQGSGLAMVSNTGTLDLTGTTLTLSQALQLTAKQDVVLSGVNISVPVMTVVAGGNIHNGGTTGTITVNGLALTATGNILMPQTQFNLGNGTITGVSGDPSLLTDLAAAGLAPASSNPNALFAAGGQLQIGGLNFSGSYLYLQGTSVSVLGPVTTASGTVVQFAPLVPSDSIGIENAPATTATINISNQQFMSLFPGTTIAVGSGVETGNVTIGSNGAIALPSNTNLVVLTTGTVTGLSNITSTGVVKNLLGTVVYVPTTGDIDPTASSTSSSSTDTSTTDSKKKKQTTEETGDESTNDDGTVQQDTSTDSVCRG